MLVQFIKKLAATNTGRNLILFFMSVIRRASAFSIFNIAYYFCDFDTSRVSGIVTKVGKNGISGIAWGNKDDEPAKVELLVNGKVINTTYASQKIYYPMRYYGEFIGFYFPMKKIWRYIDKNQKIEIHIGDQKLSYRVGLFNRTLIPCYGSFTEKKLKTAKNIINLVEQGRLINKFGRIQRPRNNFTSWTDKVLPAFSPLNKIFEEKYKKQIFIFYGGLLGFARDGGIIAHDCDLDLAYFSKEKDPYKVRNEFYRIAESIAKEYGNDTSFSDNKINFNNISLSVTPVWINSNGEFSCTFAYVGDSFKVVEEDIFPIKKIEYEGYELNLPANPENIVKYIYGRGWKYPDPGWKWLLEYKTRTPIFKARLSSSQVKKLNNIASGKTK